MNYHLPRFLVPYFKDYVAKIGASEGIILESQNTSSAEDTDEVHMAFLENESYQKITLMEENYWSPLNLL